MLVVRLRQEAILASMFWLRKNCDITSSYLQAGAEFKGGRGNVSQLLDGGTQYLLSLLNIL